MHRSETTPSPAFCAIYRWRRQLREAIAESLPELILEPVSDFLAPLRQEGT